MPTVITNILTFRRLASAYLAETKTLSFDEAHARRAYWASELIHSFGIEWTIENPEALYIGKPCIYVANHTCALDPIVMCCIFDRDVRFLAKSTLFKIPLLSRALKLEKHIPVYRGTHDQARFERLKASVHDTIADGGSVFIFPEGTRSATGKMGEFKLGAFFNAIQNDVPVVPILLRGLFEIMPKTTLRIKPGRCYVRVLPAMSAPDADLFQNEHQRAQQFSQNVRQAMVDGFATWKNEGNDNG